MIESIRIDLPLLICHTYAGITGLYFDCPDCMHDHIYNYICDCILENRPCTHISYFEKSRF